MATRPKVPKAVQTKVLTASRRRCCVCFALHGDGAVKEGQIAHLDDDPANNDDDNLTWLCLFHHAKWHARNNIAKGLTVEEVKEYRARLHRAIEEGAIPGGDEPPLKIQPTFNTTTGEKSTVINTVGDVTYNNRGGRRAATIAPPPEAIGSNAEMRAYLEYLVGRYIEWRKMAISRGIDRRPFFHGVMNNLIKKEFGARANLVPQSRFDEVVAFVQKSIDQTIWGRRNPQRNYHSFEEHCRQVRGE
jgi:hypothetical protein